MTQSHSRRGGGSLAAPGGQVFEPPDVQTDDTKALLERIDHVLGRNEQAHFECLPSHGTAPVPLTVLEAFRAVVSAMAQGQSVTLVPYGRVLTTQEAADLLHVSRPHLVKLLENGEIPYFRTDDRAGAHRRVNLRDVLAYRDARNQKRRSRLRELTRLSAEYEGEYR